jgi:hypothetical protein
LYPAKRILARGEIRQENPSFQGESANASIPEWF